MTAEITQYGISDLQVMANAMAKSNLFGVKNPDQALALMLISQAEGLHPALAARDYDIISGRPAKKPEAMLRDFLANGGKVEWHQLDDTKADATFSHSQGGSIRITWDFDRANQAGLGGKDNWKKYPRQMLRARCISEGIRTVYPAATSGSYTPEEAKDIPPAEEREMKDVTPVKPALPEVDNDKLFYDFKDALTACDSIKTLQSLWTKISKDVANLPEDLRAELTAVKDELKAQIEEGQEAA